MPANAAFYHHPDGTATDSPRLMGRHVAGAGFLAGFARHAGVDRLYGYTLTASHFADFESRVIAANPAAAPRARIPRGAFARLAEPGCLSYPSPRVGPIAWQRRHIDQRAFSVCGVFHTTAGTEPMDAIGSFATAPLQGWDAVVCPSQAVRRTVDHVLGAWCDYLGGLTGGRIAPKLQLPVIPLGVDTDAFAIGRVTDEAKAAWRARHGLGDEIVVLYVGRLSYHAKANPFPMLVALEDAAERTGRAVRLVMAGWFASETIERQIRAAADALGRRVAVTVMDGRTPEGRTMPWFVADIFASLVDNVQETFGLTPIEAMAAGLPVVASDWNGYRETIRHGVDGFLVPTLAPAPGGGIDLSLRHALGLDSYDRYIGGAAQSIAVDIGAASDAFAALIADAEMRRRMGEAGRERARVDYDWRVVVARYQELWTELADRRTRDTERAPRRPGTPADPLRDDPYAAFAHYPTGLLDAGTVLERVPGATLDRAYAASPLLDYAANLLPDRSMLARALAVLDRGPTAARDVIAALSMRGGPAALRGLAWLVKAGVARVRPAR